MGRRGRRRLPILSELCITISLVLLLLPYCGIHLWLYVYNYQLLPVWLILLFCFCDVNSHSFIFTQRTPFNISYRASMVIMVSLSFCLFRKVAILQFFLKNRLARYRILDWLLFSSIFWIYLLIVSLKFLLRNLPIILWEFVPLYITSFFSIVTQICLFIFDFCQFSYNVFWCSPNRIQLFESLGTHESGCPCVFLGLRIFQSLLFYMYLFSLSLFFWNSIKQILFFSLCLIIPKGNFFTLFHYFSFIFSVRVISNVLSSR